MIYACAAVSSAAGTSSVTHEQLSFCRPWVWKNSPRLTAGTMRVGLLSLELLIRRWERSAHVLGRRARRASVSYWSESTTVTSGVWPRLRKRMTR
jgi:hypothetical protein